VNNNKGWKGGNVNSKKGNSIMIKLKELSRDRDRTFEDGGGSRGLSLKL
jgi:hypothetical protein